MKPLPLLFALLLAQTIYAQPTYLPGFIVTNKGDTLHGQIDYRKWNRNPLSISFKSESSATSTDYKPVDIRSFFVQGEYYESATVNLNTSPDLLLRLDSSAFPVYVRSSLFLLSLYRGEKRLLIYKDREDKNNFFIVVAGEFIPLVYKRYISDPATRSVGENVTYKGALVNYLADCPALKPKIVSSTYTVSSLVKLFKGYYECTDKTATDINERRESKSEVGLVAGVSLSTLAFWNYPDYLTKINYSTSTNPTVGIYWDFALRSTRLKISNDFLYTSFKVTGSGPFDSSNPPTRTTDAKFDFSYIKTHHMLQINLVKNRLLYAAAGGSLGLAIKKDGSVNIVYNTGLVSPREVDYKTFEFGYLVGLGTSIKKWSLEARYEGSSGIADYPETSTKRMYFLLRYRISK